MKKNFLDKSVSSSPTPRNTCVLYNLALAGANTHVVYLIKHQGIDEKETEINKTK